MSYTIVPTKAPNLQAPAATYTQAQQAQLVNQLKLYFTQVDNANYALIRRTGSTVVLQWLNAGT